MASMGLEQQLRTPGVHQGSSTERMSHHIPGGEAWEMVVQLLLLQCQYAEAAATASSLCGVVVGLLG
jgi:hypothetical protein